MRLTRGCSEPFRASRSRGTLTTRLSTAGARSRRSLCSMSSGHAWQSAVWNYIQQRPRSSTAVMMTAGNVREYQVRLPRVLLPPSTSEEPVGKVFRKFPAGDQRQGRHGDTPDHPQLADGVHQEQPAPGGSGELHQPCGAGLAELLRAVLSLEVHSGAPAFQRGPRTMGAMEVQAVQTPRTCVDALAGVARRDPKLFVLWELGDYGI